MAHGKSEQVTKTCRIINLRRLNCVWGRKINTGDFLYHDVKEAPYFKYVSVDKHDMSSNVKKMVGSEKSSALSLL